MTVVRPGWFVDGDGVRYDSSASSVFADVFTLRHGEPSRAPEYASRAVSKLKNFRAYRVTRDVPRLKQRDALRQPIPSIANRVTAPTAFRHNALDLHCLAVPAP
ncbi:hypothetical protein RE6C_03187 [Rhodopirellula europaea 6C]|uniref:Uncharacterized protein n=1 Tax=Rhodopirellula europaea 6C TaxID=1263867 RepID=M2B1I6_9BACT|nr:hypothetical protein RE6C_03187 [Rhodopirellula europaea 6C]